MYSYSIRLVVLVTGLLLTGKLYGQDAIPVQPTALAQPDGYGTEGNFLAGRVIKHSPKFTAPIPALTTAFDVNFVLQTCGKKDWEQRRNYPLIGVGITYTDYGNNAVFGNCIGIYPNLQVPIIKKEKFEFTFRFGDGLGYVTRKFQRTAPIDTVNTAIGTNLNDFAIFMFDLRYHLNQHWHLQYGINLTHISNAAFDQPNLGVNTLGAHIGLMYFPGTCRPKRIVKELPKLPNRWLFEAKMDISYARARALGNPVLPTYMPSAFVSRRWLSKNKFYGGVDYAFHNDVLAFMRYYDVDHGHQRQESWDGYVFVGNEFLMGRLGLVTQLGVNYHQTFLKYDPYCEKIGGNFYVLKTEHGPIKELFISGLLLAHGLVAELSEFGLGVGI